jgi:hypothetical protein
MSAKTGPICATRDYHGISRGPRNILSSLRLLWRAVPQAHVASADSDHEHDELTAPPFPLLSTDRCDVLLIFSTISRRNRLKLHVCHAESITQRSALGRQYPSSVASARMRGPTTATSTPLGSCTCRSCCDRDTGCKGQLTTFLRSRAQALKRRAVLYRVCVSCETQRVISSLPVLTPISHR